MKIKQIKLSEEQKIQLAAFRKRYRYSTKNHSGFITKLMEVLTPYQRQLLRDRMVSGAA